MRKQLVLAVVIGLMAGLVIGYGCASRPVKSDAAAIGQPAGAAEIWTCSMHPQIRQPKAGDCPICGMDLIPVSLDASPDAGHPRQLTLSPAARQLAEVAVAPVERRSVSAEIRLVGKVQYDQTRLAFISPRVAGRIDRLFANFTGMPIKTGDHLADMYSPDLVAAQQDLLQASTSSTGLLANASLLKASRERLRLWGLTVEQIAEIERSGQVRDHVTFFSPLGGIVVEKEAREGMYVEPGMRLFTVADLSRVWVQLDAYESDLAALRYAQDVAFEAEAYPGETFKGTIAFIDPMLDPMTRTVKVRVNVENLDGRLKPEMFVRARVQAVLSGSGSVLSRNLAGKWICPMHPEIVKDGAAACDICGMPLMPAEKLGYASPQAGAEELPLVIPATAPLVTGKRAVVYVALPGREGAYEGRDVVLGARAGDYYLVRDGLKEGEQVVVSGNFKIDSSLQIQGKPSMMAPEAGPPPAAAAPAPAAIETPAAFRRQLDAVLEAVLAMGGALAGDDEAAARASLVKAREALAAVAVGDLSESACGRWMISQKAFGASIDKLAGAADMAALRLGFAAVSADMAALLKAFGPVRAGPVYVIHCPMAFDNRGADWLQADRAVRNPYFGKAMFSCGEVVETLPPVSPGPAEGTPRP